MLFQNLHLHISVKTYYRSTQYIWILNNTDHWEANIKGLTGILYHLSNIEMVCCSSLFHKCVPCLWETRKLFIRSSISVNLTNYVLNKQPILLHCFAQYLKEIKRSTVIIQIWIKFNFLTYFLIFIMIIHSWIKYYYIFSSQGNW